jgi:hypothetical protein
MNMVKLIIVVMIAAILIVLAVGAIAIDMARNFFSISTTVNGNTNTAYLPLIFAGEIENHSTSPLTITNLSQGDIAISYEGIITNQYIDFNLTFVFYHGKEWTIIPRGKHLTIQTKKMDVQRH